MSMLMSIGIATVIATGTAEVELRFGAPFLYRTRTCTLPFVISSIQHPQLVNSFYSTFKDYGHVE
jgi:hypothetical protein